MKRSFFIPAFLLLILSLAAFVPASANGQDATQMSTLTEHLKTELQRNSPLHRHLALIDVVALAHCPDDCQVMLASAQNRPLRTTEQMDLTALGPELLESYRRGPGDGQRIMALSALIGIGDEDALSTIVEEGTRKSSRLDRRTQRILATYYLETYPELAPKAKWTGMISLVDVDRAKKVRARKAEKIRVASTN